MIQKRQVIVLAIAAAILAGSVGITKLMKNPAKKSPEMGQMKKGKPNKVEGEQYTVTTSPYAETITLNGTAEAVQSMELTPTVTGYMVAGSRPFREGTRFKKGEILFQIDQGAFGFDLRARRSAFHTLILKVLPEIAIDFPESVTKWETYARSIRPDSPLKNLPEPSSERERMILSAKEIFTTYWTLRGLEQKATEYTFSAPFDGVITVANSTGKANIQAGKSVGIFTGTGSFEITLALPASRLESVKVGSPVNITVQETGAEIGSSVKRINSVIDQGSRTLNLYCSAEGNCFDGSFVTAKIPGVSHKETAKIPSRFMVDGTQVRVKEGKESVTKSVEVLARLDGFVIIKGLRSGTVLTR